MSGDGLVRVVGSVQQLVHSLQLVHSGNGVRHVEVLKRKSQSGEILRSSSPHSSYLLSIQLGRTLRCWPLLCRILFLLLSDVLESLAGLAQRDLCGDRSLEDLVTPLGEMSGHAN